MQRGTTYFRKAGSYVLLPVMLIFSACGTSPENQGSSTPIDSTNTYGTAPATYGADDPADDTIRNLDNYSDTGTKVNEGPDNTR
jgi:hypothetical protein